MNNQLEHWRGRLGLSDLRALPHDASTRRYFRASEGVLMLDLDADGEARIGRFLDVAQRLRAAGILVPEIYQSSAPDGFVLMQDFGGVALKDAASEENLRAAFREIEKFKPVDAEGLKFYSQEVYREEVSRLMRFYLAPLGIADDEILTLAAPEFEELAAKSEQFVHLDYHAENILITKQGLGVIDFQDARMGHKLYDLVCFVDAERAPISPHLQAEFTDGLSLEERRDFVLISAQRLMKIIGIFARLAGEGREKYIDLLPQIFAILQARFDVPELKLWREWFNDVVPEPSAQILSQLQEKE